MKAPRYIRDEATRELDAQFREMLQLKNNAETAEIAHFYGMCIAKRERQIFQQGYIAIYKRLPNKTRTIVVSRIVKG